MGRLIFQLAILVLMAPMFAMGNPCGDTLDKLGAHYDADQKRLHFGVVSSNAERVEVFLYEKPEHDEPIAAQTLERQAGTNTWTQSMPFDKWDPNEKPLYYGLRAWGPNWKHDPAWTPGSLQGFIADVDYNGNRFNPNKLLSDVRAMELSHDPKTFRNPSDSVYASGEENRHRDSGPVAPKGIILPKRFHSTVPGPKTPFKDDVIYEVHVRGFTMNDPSIPKEERGTYKGAAKKAAYLKELGVTAVEFLPVHESQSEANREEDTSNNNYWGYMTENFFAPNRRNATEASQRKVGGVTEEFRDMVDEFHRHGIKVFIDVVYNHTGESGAGGPQAEAAQIRNFRGIDNALYYQTAGDKRFYKDNTGCGANFNCAVPEVRDLGVDSLKHYAQMGVDGFRFDLAPVLMNTRATGNDAHFDMSDPNNIFNRAKRELPGVELIAEPWAIGDYSFQLGNFTGMAEWNGKFRDAVRRAINLQDVDHPTPGELASRMTGSRDLLGHNPGGPSRSVNFVAAHDGFTLNDLVSYNKKHNDQAAPFGPSDGGEDHNLSWDQKHEGDSPEKTRLRQRQAARNAMAMTMLAQGVPMFNGGDEFLRTQRGNNNMWNVDSSGSWIDWSEKERNVNFHDFTKRMIEFRRSHPSFRPSDYASGEDANGNGLRDVSWYRNDGKSAEARDLPEGEKGYMSDGFNRYLGMRVDGEKHGEWIRSTYVGMNLGTTPLTVTLPEPAAGKRWYWVGDTDEAFESIGNIKPLGHETPLATTSYRMAPRSLLLLVEK